MKIRKTLKNKNTQKNATVYEHNNSIIVQIAGYGVIVDRTAIEKKSLVLFQNIRNLKKNLIQPVWS